MMFLMLLKVIIYWIPPNCLGSKVVGSLEQLVCYFAGLEVPKERKIYMPFSSTIILLI